MGKNLNKNIGLNVRYLRKIWGFSQEEIGKALGLHQTAICRIEKGSQRLTAEELYVLSVFLKEPINGFFS